MAHKKLEMTKKPSSCFAVIYNIYFSLISFHILKSLILILNRKKKKKTWKVHASYEVMILYNRIKHLAANHWRPCKRCMLTRT